jgi:uncharacterized repeat protein (TIGR03803 family)
MNRGGSIGGLYGGTVDKVLIGSGHETTLHSFGALNDGANPQGNLVEIGGVLYGTTFEGGVNGGGTLYSVNPATRAETVLHSFGAGTDALFPMAGLINVGGVLYGTTFYGGSGTGCDHPGCGTVFSFDTSNGAYAIVYSFQGGDDGAFPRAAVLSVGGHLYGTTAAGGTANSGTIYHVDPSNGTEAVDHTFAGGSDGSNPQAELIDVGGTLYGTTVFGGSTDANCQPQGCGTVFALSPASDTETVLYRFKGNTDGGYPVAALVYWRNQLWGTTESGGKYQDGTIFSVDPKKSQEAVEFSFGNGPGGLNPQAPLTNAGSVLYGTAYYNTIFKVAP